MSPDINILVPQVELLVCGRHRGCCCTMEEVTTVAGPKREAFRDVYKHSMDGDSLARPLSLSNGESRGEFASGP